MSGTLKGIGMMVFAMFVFACTDASIKFMLRYIAPAQVLLILGFGITLVFSLTAHARGQKLFSPVFFHPVVLCRSFCEAFVTAALITAISQAPLSTTVALMQVNPVLVTLGAALFFRDAIGWRRWLAILVAFIGMLMILQPVSERFDPSTMIGVLAALALGVRDLLTRAAPPGLPMMALNAWGFAFAPLTALALLSVPGTEVFPMTLPIFWLSVLCITSVFLGLCMLTYSTRFRPLSIIAPFRYARVFFAFMVGIVFFEEQPNFLIFLGTFLIVVAGIFCFLLERNPHSSLNRPFKPNRTQQEDEEPHAR